MTKHITLLVVAATMLSQACSKDAQTDKAVETRTADGQLSTSMSGDSADKRGTALVRVVNAVPSSQGLHVRSDETHMLPDVAFQKVSPYQNVDQTWATFQVGDGAAPNFVPLSTNREMLTDGHRYTMVILRSEDGSGYQTRVLRDVVTNEPGKARLRVIHAAPGAASIMVKARSGETMFDGVDYSDEAGFKAIAPWSGVLEFRGKDGKQLLASTPNLTFEAGKSYTVVITKTKGGKIESFWFEDNQQM